MRFRNAMMTSLLLMLFSLVGCQKPATPTSGIQVVKTVVGEGRDIEGALSIEGDCVRVNGQALAWEPMLDVQISGDTLRVTRKWNGQTFLLQNGDQVYVMGECIIKTEGGPCVTPSVEEVNAVTGCKSGPYFTVGNLRKIETPTPIPPSPTMKKQ